MKEQTDNTVAPFPVKLLTGALALSGLLLLGLLWSAYDTYCKVDTEQLHDLLFLCRQLDEEFFLFLSFFFSLPPAQHFHQLGSFFAARGRWKEAAQMFRRASSLAPDSYRAWSNLGGVLTMSCDFPAGLEAYDKALALQPDNPIAASNLGVTQLWMGRYAEAVASLQRAARYAPDYQVEANLGDAYRSLRGNEANSARAYEGSIALAREQLRLNPNDATAHSWLATGLAKTRRSAEAGSEIKRALELDPKDPGILFDAATVAVLADRKPEALGWLRKAVERGYCRDIIVRQQEFERFSHDPAFQAIIAAPPRAAGS